MWAAWTSTRLARLSSGASGSRWSSRSRGARQTPLQPVGRRCRRAGRRSWHGRRRSAEQPQRQHHQPPDPRPQRRRGERRGERARDLRPASGQQAGQSRGQGNRPRGARRRGQLPVTREGQGQAEGPRGPRRPCCAADWLRYSPCPASTGASGRRSELKRPKVTQAELANKYPALLVADRASFQLRFYKNLQLVKSYTVAVGGVWASTPGRAYHIQNKAVDPAGTVPTLTGPASQAGTVVRAAPRRTRSRRAGWESSTARAFTAPTTPTHWAAPPRTVASGWPYPM